MHFLNLKTSSRTAGCHGIFLIISIKILILAQVTSLPLGKCIYVYFINLHKSDFYKVLQFNFSVTNNIYKKYVYDNIVSDLKSLPKRVKMNDVLFNETEKNE